jgi:tetratricopeptide (TPR) repeat protein
LIPLFILWANIHIYFFIGLALVFFKLASRFLVQFSLQKEKLKTRLWLVSLSLKEKIVDFCLLLIACLFTPNHIWGLLYPLNIFRNYGYQIAENKSIFFLENLMLNYNFQIFKLMLLLLVIGLGAYWVITKKNSLFNIFFGIFISLLALFASRNLALFGLVSLVIISACVKPAIDFLKEKLAQRYSYLFKLSELYFFIILIIAIIFSIIFLIFDSSGRQTFMKGQVGLGLRDGSADSFDFFQTSGLTGPIFNNYDSGSALIFGLAGREKVFVDNRPEAYSSKFFTETYLPMQSDPEVWQQALEKYKFKTIYFSHTDSTPWGREFLNTILKDSNWTLVYFDRYFIVLAATSGTPSEILKKYSINSWEFRDRLRKLASESDLKSKFVLADFAQVMNYPDLAEEIYHQIIINQPRNERVISSLAYLYSSSSDRVSLFKAIDYFKKAIKIENQTPGIYNQLALVYWKLADYKNAEYYWLQAKKINRKDANAIYYLDQVDNLRRRGMLPL